MSSLSGIGDVSKFTAMQDEIAKHELASSAYKKMLSGKLMSADESNALKTVIDSVDKLNAIKMRNEALKSSMPMGTVADFAKAAEVSGEDAVKKAKRKFLGLPDNEAEKEEKVEEAAEVKEEKTEEPIEVKEDENIDKAKEKEDDIEEVKEIKDNKKTEKKANNYNSAPSEQDLFLASLMKDTPQGQYANALAKAHAEAEASKKHYTDAFTRLRHSADNGGFERMLDEAPELADPSHVNNAKKYYKTLASFAPSLALDPVVAASFVKKINAYGGMDEKMVQGLIQSNNEHMKHHANMSSN